MSYKAIRAKLMERAVGPVDERMVEYVLRHFDEVTFMSSEKLCYTLGCSAEELQAFCAGFGAVSLLDLMGLLREVVYSRDSEGSDAEKASDDLEQIVQTALTEAQIESLIIAKGYTDCVAYMSEEGISVAVAAPEGGLQQGDVAVITDIVLTQSDYDMTDIRVVEVP